VRSFEVLGSLRAVETIATGCAIRELPRLVKYYGRGRWRERKALGRVRLPDGTVREAEIHWYEAPGIGRKELKIKRYREFGP
jgi:hypothetical protein